MRLKLSIERRQVEQQARRVHVEIVGTSRAGFLTFLRQHEETTRIAREDLSQQARDILQQAITDEYTETATYSEGFEETLAAVRNGWEVTSGEAGGQYLVVYNGTLYRAEIQVTAWG